MALLERLADWNDTAITSVPPPLTAADMRFAHARLVAFGSPEVVELLNFWHLASRTHADLDTKLTEQHGSPREAPHDDYAEFVAQEFLAVEALGELQDRIHEELQGSKP